MQALNCESPYLRCPGPVNESETLKQIIIQTFLEIPILENVKITNISAILRGKE
jgi:hypothetical protein